jgi:cytosine/adenosine deaminase-related metal-dependent hydrolase
MNPLSFHKFKADYLFDGYHLLDPQLVLITDQAGKIIEIVPETDAGGDIQQFNGLLSPGFVNAHCHLELSHMKGLIPEKTGLIDFVFNIVTQRNRFTEEQVQQAIAAAEREMITNCIMAVGDICNTTSTLFQKQSARLFYYNFIETSGWIPSIAGNRFEKSTAFLHAFEALNNHHQLQQSSASYAPHAPYSVSEPLWALMEPHFSGKTTTIHNQETRFEDDLFRQGTGDFVRMYQMMNIDNSFYQPSGKSSLQTYLHHFEKARNVLLVHDTFIQEEDLEVVRQQSITHQQGIYFCLCVNANLYIENALPPLDLLAKNPDAIVIGTDSLASNHSLSILDELKTIQLHFPGIPVTNLLQWATANGAAALQMQERLGSFEKGKTPGIILLENVPEGKISPNTTVRRLL